MPVTRPITGIILSGGTSRRMGSDKALMQLHDKPFLYWISEALRPLVTSILVVSNKESHKPYGDQMVADLQPDQGPLMGIYSGLKASTTDLNLIVSCDLPRVSASLLANLVDRWNESSPLITYQTAHGTSPILGLMDKTICEPLANQLLEQGERRYQSLLDGIAAQTLPVSADQQVLLEDVNTPQQLKKIQHEIEH